MKDYQKRAELEAKELDDKLNKLNEFLFVECIFQNVLIEKANDLLIEQSVHMTAYLGVLRKRLKMFHDMNTSI